MKTKITFKNSLTTAVIAVMILFGFNAKAQTYVYNETVSSGIYFWPTNGSQVTNPVSDVVNSSANCAVSSTNGNWSQIQFFPNPKYTPVSGDKLYFSVYNPNGAGPGQIQFRYTSNQASWQFGGDVTYVSGSVTGWVEYSIALTNHVGNEIDQVIMMPAGNSASAVYIDNIYFGQTSVLPTQNTIVYNETTNSGIYFWPTNGSQVANPISDAVNSSANCAVPSTDGNWSQIQYFPTYTPVSGDKLYFSVYNPNGAGPGQVQFSYTGSGSWVGGTDVTYVSGSLTGWVEYSVNLTSHVGNEIDNIIMMPAGNSASVVYIDNIYFGQTSIIPVPQNPIVYNETTNWGIYFWPTNGSQVANPKSDTVNSSANCAVSSTDGNWSQIQYFPTYKPASGNKLYFSVYNPNGAGPGQVQFSYTGSGSWVGGTDVTYVSGSLTGWVEYSIDLTSHVGSEIDQVIMMPAGNSASAVYIDNIYFGSTSTLGTNSNSLAKVNNQVFVSKDGKIQFTKEQTNTQLSVFDLSGRLILEEKINGVKVDKVLNTKGIYILRVQSDSGVSSQKIIF
ncbi:T9SS type A sorting domain-containing protein [Flavobacterium sp.]|uniref:T9SS type A sorting domain-containing protein n=1 Tax=Flavobacterium sp. TaxID=239 RepID=UPI003752C4AB